MEYIEKVKLIGRKEDELLTMVQNKELEILAHKLRGTVVSETKDRELILEDMNVIIKDMKALMLDLYKLNEK